MVTIRDPGIQVDPVERILDRLSGVRPSGEGYAAQCPGHEDRHASLTIGRGPDGRALVHCHAQSGCTAETIMGSIGMALADLFPQGQGRNDGSDSRLARPTADVGRAKRESVQARARSRKETRRIKYDIRECNGTLAARHVRVEYDDGGKDFLWERPNGESGLNGRPIATLPLYRSEDLASLADGCTVVLCEGEKACLALLDAGIPAVATVTGAKATPTSDVLRCLTRFDVVLWPDHDNAGHAHMHMVAERLLALEARS
jgi:putative DNA primase/helicase